MILSNAWNAPHQNKTNARWTCRKTGTEFDHASPGRTVSWIEHGKSAGNGQRRNGLFGVKITG